MRYMRLTKQTQDILQKLIQLQEMEMQDYGQDASIRWHAIEREVRNRRVGIDIGVLGKTLICRDINGVRFSVKLCPGGVHEAFGGESDIGYPGPTRELVTRSIRAAYKAVCGER